MRRRHFIARAGIGLALAASGLVMGPAWAQGAPSTARFRILVVGDSLSAEYGLKRGSGWVSLMEQRLAKEKIPAEVRNASISGDTTSGGRARLAPLLQSFKPTHVVFELGANDALRGLPVKNTEDNLREMTTAAQQAGARVLLVGMQVPPNYGGDYSTKFAAVFTEIAKERKVPLVPFLLKGVADVADPAKLFQADRLHPNELAHPAMLDNVWSELRKLLK